MLFALGILVGFAVAVAVAVGLCASALDGEVRFK